MYCLFFHDSTFFPSCKEFFFSLPFSLRPRCDFFPTFRRNAPPARVRLATVLPRDDFARGGGTHPLIARECVTPFGLLRGARQGCRAFSSTPPPPARVRRGRFSPLPLLPRAGGYRPRDMLPRRGAPAGSFFPYRFAPRSAGLSVQVFSPPRGFMFPRRGCVPFFGFFARAVSSIALRSRFCRTILRPPTVTFLRQTFSLASFFPARAVRLSVFG